MLRKKEAQEEVVWIQDTETGGIQHFGVICADTKGFNLEKEISKATAQWRSKKPVTRTRFASNGIGVGDIAENQAVFEFLGEHRKPSKLT